MLQSLLQRLPFSLSPDAPAGAAPLVIVEMSEVAIRYLVVKANEDEGVPYSLVGSGCLRAADYSDNGSWHEAGAQALRECKPSRAKVIGLLAPNDYEVYQMEPEEAEDHETLVAVMADKLTTTFSVDFSDFCVDVVPMASVGETGDVLVVAARKEVVSMRLEQYRAIGLEADVLTVHEVGHAHLVSGLLPESSYLAGLCVTETDFLFGVYDDSRMVMVRRIPKEAITFDDSVVPMHVMDDVTRSLEEVSQLLAGPVVEAFFVDAGSNTSMYVSAFKQVLGLECEALTPYACLAEEVEDHFYEEGTNALAGVAIAWNAGIANIDFLRKETSGGDQVDAVESASSPKAWFSRSLTAVAAAMAVVIIGLGCFMSWNEAQTQAIHARALQNHLSAVDVFDKQADARSVPAENIENLQQVLQSYSAIHSYLSSQAGQGEANFSAWLEALARSVPEGLWITNVEFSAVASGRLGLMGLARSNEEVVLWTERLNNTYLEGRKRFSISESKELANGYWSFVIQAQGSR